MTEETQISTSEAVGFSDVRQELWGTVRRGDRELEVLLGGGSRWMRFKSARSILKWNKWARKDSKKAGVEFPADAPTHYWQVNWKNVWQAKG